MRLSCFFLLFFMLLSSFNLMAQDHSDGLCGAYTIGGDMPDFETFNAAVDALEMYGVCGAVEMNVRDGVYEERVSLNAVSGADNSLNTITFESESGDNSAVILTPEASNSTNNYTFRLIHADWIRVKNMTIQATNENYEQVIDISGSCKNNLFEGNIIQGVLTSSTQSGSLIKYSGIQQNSDNNHFINNHFIGGNYGIFLNPSNHSFSPKGVLIKNNIFENQHSNAIYTAKSWNLTVQQNSFFTNNNSLNYTAILLILSRDTLNIEKNKIFLEKGNGIYYSGNYRSIDLPAVIANNYIEATNDQYPCNGILLDQADYTNIYFNSVNLKNAESTAFSIDDSAFSVENGDHIHVKNNIFSNLFEGNLIEIDNFVDVTQTIFSHNNYYSKKEFFIYYGQTDLNLQRWQTEYQQDLETCTYLPYFESTGTGCPQNSLLTNKGFPIPDILEDINGNPRDTNYPDIGVCEFEPLLNDASLVQLLSPLPITYPGKNPVKVVLRNHGTDLLEAATIQMLVNSNLTSIVNWSGGLAFGESDTIQVDSILFSEAQVYDLKVWVFEPNGLEDDFTQNDTLILKDIKVGMGGLYTIGGNEPDFQDFTAAIEALSFYGIGGDVTFNVRDGMYSERLELTSIEGNNENYWITFQSESGNNADVILTERVGLDNVSYLTLKGMTIEKQVFLENDCHHFNFINNSTGNFFDNETYFYSKDILRDCVIKDNYFYARFNGIYLRSTEEENLNQNILIEDNVFESMLEIAIQIENSFENNIQNNIVSSIVDFSSGIYLSGNNGNNRIENNKISIVPDLDVYGLGIGLSTNNQDINSPNIIANNFIYIHSKFGSDEVSSVVGIRLLQGTGVTHIFNNTIDVSGYPIMIGERQDLKVFNNIFHTTQDQAMVIQDGLDNLELNNNNYYTANSPLIQYYSADNEEQNFADLSTWKSFSNQDANSLSVDPIFRGENDVHIQNLDLRNSGKAIAEIIYDIDGEIREGLPDIGADEIELKANDAALLRIDYPLSGFAHRIAPGQTPIHLSLYNFGEMNLQTTTIHYKVNDEWQGTYQWQGNLPLGVSEDSIQIGTFEAEYGTSYDIEAWVESANGLMDENQLNDTVRMSNIRVGLIGTYTIGGENPDFINFNSATYALRYTGVAGEVIFKVRPGTYEERITLTDVISTSESKQVYFEPENEGDVVNIAPIANSFHNNTIELSGSSWLNFKGLVFNKISTSRPRVALIENGSEHNTFSNCQFLTNSTPSGSGEEIDNIVCSSDYNTFSNNIVHGGRYGLNISGNAVKVAGNYCLNQRSIGIRYISGKLPFIEDNIIENAGVGISIFFSPEIEGGYIKNNKLIDLSSVGISIGYSNATSSNVFVVANNFIEHKFNVNFVTGINLYDSHYIDFYNNTIAVYEQDNEHNIFKTTNACTNLRLLNNSFTHLGGEPVLNLESTNNISLSDFNNFYTTGDQLVKAESNYETLEDFQMGTGHDMNSISVDPLFIERGGYVSQQVAMNAAATPLAEVTTDIENNPRNPQSPDIGAYEFDVQDLELLNIQSSIQSCEWDNTEPISLQVKNGGEVPINNFQISYQLNNNDLVTEIIDLFDLNINETKNYTLENRLNLAEEGVYELTLFVDYEHDFVRQNDTIKTIIEYYLKDTTYLTQMTCDPNQVGLTEIVLTNQFDCDSLLIENTILDNIPPVANCQNITLNLSNHSIEINALDINDNSSDNCMIDFMGLDVATFDCDQLGEHLVQLTVADQAGNQAICEATVTVKDSGLPSANCIESLDITLVADEPYILEVQTLNAQSSDNCSLAENLGLSFSAFSTTQNIALDCDDIDLESLTLWVTDEAGHQDFCEVTINIERGNRDCNCEKTNLNFGTAWIAPTIYKVSNQITAAGQVNSPNQAVIFRAGESIELLGGFEVVLGSPFSAEIEGCLISGGSLSDQDMAQQRSRENTLHSSSLVEMDLKVQPNPFKNKTILQYKLDFAQSVEVSLLNLSGVFLETLQASQWQETGTYQLELDGRNLIPGIYLICWRGEKTQVMKKLVLW